MPRSPATAPSGDAAPALRSRVKGLAVLPCARIRPDPDNFRVHGDRQREALRAVLRDLGSVSAVLVRPASAPALRSLRKVQRGDGAAFQKWLAGYRAGFVLVDGHLRVDEAGPDGQVECLVLDLDEREAAEALATFDAVGDLAGFDQAAFLRNAERFNSTEPEVQRLVAELAKVRAADEREVAGIAQVEQEQGAEEGSRIDVDPSQGRGETGPSPFADDGSEDPHAVDVHDLRAPFPWFGGKSRAAGIVWAALGNVPNYVEPFAGSLAVLLARPGGPGKIETVNDLDRWVANFWRAVAQDPEAVAKHADWPVNEADLHARHKWLLTREEWKARMQDGEVPDFFDVKIAGWWVWGLCAWIGSGWCAPKGEQPSAQVRHLSGLGQGIHGAVMAEPSEQLPHLGNAGRGVASPSLATAYEKLPDLGNAGRGVHRARLDDPPEQLPMFAHGARGVHRGALPIQADVLTANILAWMLCLRDRLRRVRVACGSWERVLTPAVTTGHGLTGVFLDPPYAEGADDLYGHHDKSVSADVRRWAIEHGGDPLLRIAFCGYAGEHEEFPPGWCKVAWKAQGGYGSSNGNPHRERIWLSPHCLRPGEETGFPTP